jgi:predicted metal-dependent hydrolase
MAEQLTAEDHPIDTPHEAPPRGRTPAMEPERADETFRRGVALFNGVRYWHAHEAWEDLWRAAADEDRDFYQGLIQLAAGLLHLQRRNARGARNKLREGVERLRAYQPTHRGIFVNELVRKAERTLEDLDAGFLPYLIPPVIRFVELEQADWSR